MRSPAARPGRRRARAADHRLGAVQRDTRHTATDGADHLRGRRQPGELQPAPIGAVVVYALKDSSKTSTGMHYAVLPDGLQQVSPVLAAILRNNNSYLLQQPPGWGPTRGSQAPVSRVLDTRRYPSEPVSQRLPVTPSPARTGAAGGWPPAR